MTALNAIDYKIAMGLNMADIPFAALVAAAMVKADTENFAKLQLAFSAIAMDLQDRYDAPGGVTAIDVAGREIDKSELSRRASEIANGYLRRIESIP